MQASMSDSKDRLQEIDLKKLSSRLSAAGMPTQAVIARETGVSQSTVSRAAQGLIKTPSDGAQKLWAYTADRSSIVAATSSAMVRTQRATLKAKRRPRPRTRLDHTSATDISGMTLPELGELAMAGLRDYLADAFDPLLVIEQLSVLRRAQDRGTR